MMRGTTRGTAGGLATIAILAVGTSLLVHWKMRGDANHLRALLSAEIDRGSLVGLGRAQAIGRRVVLADSGDAESAALLAYVGALLATEFGQATINEAESAAALAEQDGALLGASPAAPIAGAARALVALRKGDAPRALELATAAASAASNGPHARCALGRVRAAAGDLVGASHALEAAMVEAPTFLPAKLAWAEVRLDLGDAAAAEEVLGPLVARAPEDIRAQFLLEEAVQAVAMASGAASARDVDVGLERVCGANGALTPYLVAGCGLAWSSRARIAGDHLRASTQAQAAEHAVPDEPRMLARAAQLLAQQGLVDRAEKLLERAARYDALQAPALAWARLAITLGHGRAATAPPGLRPVDATTRVLAARAAFAVGGAGALAATLDGFGARVVGADADLRLLRTLVPPAGAAPPSAPPASGGPPRAKPSAAQHYVDGLRARLAGDQLLAADHLSHALSGHADACRAAGEYVAVLRALKRQPDAAAFTTLRADDSACVDLPRAR
jgi:tetratricopeptide (TPR) repeat protein